MRSRARAIALLPPVTALMAVALFAVGAVYALGLRDEPARTAAVDTA